jgi:deazaflavin-dependent oxidoreductase (nitroreductase family)
MGLISELDFEVKEANAIPRVTQKLTSSGPGAWVFQRTLYPVDKRLFRLTKGRLTVPGLMAGLPVILLTTTGAKTGEDRTMPLVGIPIDGEMAVIGSNYGQSFTPGWVYNLRAHAEATVAHGSESVKVTARQATEAETERAFEAGDRLRRNSVRHCVEDRRGHVIPSRLPGKPDWRLRFDCSKGLCDCEGISCACRRTRPASPHASASGVRTTLRASSRVRRKVRNPDMIGICCLDARAGRSPAGAQAGIP